MPPPTLPPLPIDAVLPELLSRLRSHPAVVLQAPTGAGKTTRVPPALQEAGFSGGGQRRIVMLEPRRVAARAAARRMAQESRTTLGEQVGYHVRFDPKFTPKTEILVVTPGIFLRMLQDDPFLESVRVVILDEFHERGLEVDLALGMVRLMQQTVREDLKLLVMSATLETQKIASYLGDAPQVRSEGRLHPVEVRYLPPQRDEELIGHVLRATRLTLESTRGDLLIFLPGLGEIASACAALEQEPALAGRRILPLHGEQTPEEQDRALLSYPEGKVVVATNVAETSVTVDGVTGVIDSGLARVSRVDRTVGLDRLERESISQAAAEQRAGRAGRLAPGFAVRLWDELSHRARAMQTEPEILRVDLTAAILQLLALGETDAKNFPWLDPPPADGVERALELLELLGATRQGQLTERGRLLATLPVHPRVGVLLLETRFDPRGALAAALLSERDILQRSGGGAAGPTFSDLLDRIEMVEQFQSHRRTQFPRGTLLPGAVQGVLQVARRLREYRPRSVPTSDAGDDQTLLAALVHAYPDRVVQRRERGSPRGRMVGGRGVELARGSGVIEPEWFLALAIDAGGTESLVRMASGLERGWLPAGAIERVEVCRYDPTRDRVVAGKQTRYRDLILDESPAPLPPAQQVGRILFEAAKSRLAEVLPAAESEAGQWLLRLECLRGWLPDADLPKYDSELLLEVLEECCQGCRSLQEVRQAEWLARLKGRCRYEQLQLLDREAPTRIPVPSGSAIALQYAPGQAPVLAVRIQELFGLPETPRIARGRVGVLLHLLGPNFRPQQVTDDLASFWANTYPLVRKELRARYPKHSWPEDPLEAEAVRGPRRRKSPEA